METNYYSNLSSSNFEIKTYIFPNNNSPSDIYNFFSSFVEKFSELRSEQEKINFSFLVNSWHILINNISLFPSLFTYIENDNQSAAGPKTFINLYSNGRYKQIHYSKNTIENLFTALYLTYSKYLSYYYLTNNYKISNLNEVLLDLSGYPVYEYDFSLKSTVEFLKKNLKKMVLNSIQENAIYLLVNDNDNSSKTLNQFSYEIISCADFRKEVIYQINLYPFLKSKLKSKYNYINLIDNKSVSPIDIAHLFPSDQDPNSIRKYTYISGKDIYTKFNRLLEIKRYTYSNKLNGKFIKIKREDNTEEYISRWFYTFNVGNDNTEVTIGIHSIDLIEKQFSKFFIGIIILKSNMFNLSFVDYVPLKNQKDNFIKSFLSKGSYMIIPVCCFDFKGNQGQAVVKNVRTVPLLITDKKTKKKTLSNYCINCIEEIFERFDIDKDGCISQDEVQIFTDYIKDKISDKSILTKSLPKSSVKCSAIKKMFFEIASSKKDNEIYDIFSLFGYDKIYNYSTRLFFITVDSLQEIDLKIADAFVFPINSYSFELLTKQLGTELKIEETNSIVLYYFQVNSEVILLMLENTTGKTKSIKFELQNIKIEYKTKLNAFEKKYLFPYFIQNNDLNLDFQLIVE